MWSSASCCNICVMVGVVILVLTLCRAEKNSIPLPFQRNSVIRDKFHVLKIPQSQLGISVRGGNVEEQVDQVTVDAKNADLKSEEDDLSSCSDLHNSIAIDDTTSPNNSEEELILSRKCDISPLETIAESSADTSALQSNASILRSDGKLLHDDGNFIQAASTFSDAVKLLDDAIELSKDEMMRNEMAEERATCRLHEALCYLKEKDYTKAFTSCTDVLKDGLEVVEVENKREETEEGLISDDENPTQYIIRMSQTSENVGEIHDAMVQLTPAVRARAFHRRAKARLALNDSTGALEDAKSAAFLGDRNAVALYGKLMRECGSHKSLFGDDNAGQGYGSGTFSDIMSSYMGNPFESPSSSGNSSFGSGTKSGFGLLESLMNGSATSDDSPGGFGNMLFNSGNGDKDLGGLAKSVLMSISKRVEDKGTQESICNYLNSVDASQVITLSRMVGIPVSESAAVRLVTFVNRLTPQGINKSVKIVKRVVIVGALIRKILKVIGKYKHLIILLLLFQWCKSSIYRPIISKKTTATISKAAFVIL